MNIAEVRQQYPQYNDMTDEQLASALHQKFYSDMPAEQFAAKIGLATQQPQERSFGASLVRQAGLTARDALSGVGDIANIVLDPAVRGINAVAGTNLPIPSQAMERTLSRVLPEPASDEEKLANRVVRGMTAGAAVPGTILARESAQALPAATNALRYGPAVTTNPLAQNVGTQIASAGAGAGGSELARQGGANEWQQMLAGLGAGVAVPTSMLAAQTGARAVGRLARNATLPFTQSGREQVVARVLQDAATDPEQAITNIQGAQRYVPGVSPTTAELANDSGLSALQKTLRNQNPAAFNDVEMANDTARQARLTAAFGGPNDLQMMQAARNDLTAPLREAAFENAKPVDVTPIKNVADSILKSGAGKRQPVEAAMNWLKARLQGENDPQRIYAIRQDINDIIAGKVQDDRAAYQLAAKELTAVKGVLDNQLEKAAPGFKNYLQQYSSLSKGVDAMSTGQEITARALNPMTERLSPAMYAREFQKRGQDIANSGAAASDVLRRVNEDLKRSVAPTNAMRAAGSDTLQNIAGTETLTRMLGHAPGGVTTRLAAKGLGFLYSPFEAKTRELLLDAALHPELAQGLLARPIPQRPDLTAEMLRRFLPISYGGLLGTTAGLQ